MLSVKNEVEICRNKSKRKHKDKVGVVYMFNSQFSGLTYFLEVLFKGLLERRRPNICTSSHLFGDGRK